MATSDQEEDTKLHTTRRLVDIKKRLGLHKEDIYEGLTVLTVLAPLRSLCDQTLMST